MRPRFGPKQSMPRCAAVLVSWRQRGHLSWNASIVRSPAHGPVRSTIASVSSSMVSSASASASPIAAMTSSACSGVKRTGSGCIGTDDGRADSAPVHIGRSAVDSRCTVPRGPNVLTRVRSSQSGALHVGAGRPGDAPPDRELGGAEDLGVRSAQHGGDVGRAKVRSRFGQRVAGHPPGRDVAPGQRGRGRGLRGHGRTCSLARPTSVRVIRAGLRMPVVGPRRSGRSGPRCRSRAGRTHCRR